MYSIEYLIEAGAVKRLSVLPLLQGIRRSAVFGASAAKPSSLTACRNAPARAETGRGHGALACRRCRPLDGERRRAVHLVEEEQHALQLKAEAARGRHRHHSRGTRCKGLPRRAPVASAVLPHPQDELLLLPSVGRPTQPLIPSAFDVGANPT